MIRVKGIRQAIRAVGRLDDIKRKATASALRKVATSARGKLRRAISAREGIQLKETKNRVAWFWKDREHRRAGGSRTIKMWVGTAVPVLVPTKFTASLGGEVRLRGTVNREVSIRKAAEELVAPTVLTEFRRRFPLEYGSQMRRQIRRLRAR